MCDTIVDRKRSDEYHVTFDNSLFIFSDLNEVLWYIYQCVGQYYCRRDGEMVIEYKCSDILNTSAAEMIFEVLLLEFTVIYIRTYKGIIYPTIIHDYRSAVDSFRECSYRSIEIDDFDSYIDGFYKKMISMKQT